jgi:hypothetical protein
LRVEDVNSRYGSEDNLHRSLILEG